MDSSAAGDLRVVSWWRRPRFWLAVMVVAFFVVSVYSGIAAFDNFQTKNSTDAGIITQAVASALHGKPAPFYESYDCMDKLRCSFLLVHPGLVLYAALPFYALIPSTLTLFVLRSAFVALAAVPLYWLTRQVTRSSGKALLAAGLLLVWAPFLAGDVFSLHLESLLPLELFSLAALWQARRYRLGLAVAALSFLTFEIYPIFTCLLGIFFLIPYIERAVRSRRSRWRGGRGRGRSIRSVFSGWATSLRAALRLREVRYTLVLMLSSIVAYVVLATFMNVWGYEVLGVVSPAAHPGIAGVFYNPSTPPSPFLGSILGSAQTISTGEYWLILYALVGFLPLLSPRALILSVPWIGYTFYTDSPRFTTIGSQYTMIAAAPIFIGLAYGLVRVPSLSRTEATATTPGVSSASRPAPMTTARRRRAHRMRLVLAGVLVVVVTANVVLMPINPLLKDLGVKPRAPFDPGYFDNSWNLNPAIVYAEQLVANVPYGATVMAPPPYFPLVANNPDAYVFLSSHMNTSRLPFNVSEGPRYVLLEPSWLTKLGTDFENNLSNPQVYAMRGYVGYTTGGPLLLYERGYSIPAKLYGPPLPETNATYTPGDGIVVGPVGQLVSNSTAPSGWAIETLPGFNRTGLVWSVPANFLPPGNYTIRLVVALSTTSGSVRPNKPVFRTLVSGFGPALVNQTFNASAFVPGYWTTLTFNVTVQNPLPDLSIEGYGVADHAAIAVAAVSVRPGAPG